MAKIRHCEELQHGPVTELFPGLQTNSTDRTDREYLDGGEFSEHVRRQILQKPDPVVSTDDTGDPDLPSYDEVAEAMGVSTTKSKFKIVRA